MTNMTDLGVSQNGGSPQVTGESGVQPRKPWASLGHPHSDMLRPFCSRETRISVIDVPHFGETMGNPMPETSNCGRFKIYHPFTVAV